MNPERPLRALLLEHMLGVVLVGLSLVAVAGVVRRHEEAGRRAPDPLVARYLAIDSLDWGSPLDRALFRDALALRPPPHVRNVDSLFRAVEDTRLAQYTDPERKLGGARAVLDAGTAGDILLMFQEFLMAFAAVMVLTVAGARALAVWRFIAWKQDRSSSVRRFLAAFESRGEGRATGSWKALPAALVKGAAAAVLFAPAYVVAYALRISVDTESVLFLVPLAVVSNGVLVDTANHLYALLVAESRKGYVETAAVKGLGASYSWASPGGLRRAALFFPSRGARGHVFHDIYRNARLQFIPSIKEHAAFVVTGIAIIEMALNIKGHLCYALLQHILFREYDLAIAIVFAIFLAVKLTDAVVDLWHALEARRYANDR